MRAFLLALITLIVLRGTTSADITVEKRFRLEGPTGLQLTLFTELGSP